MGDAAEAAGFLVGRARNLDGARKIRIDGHEGFGRDDRGGEPALHVAGAAAIDAAVADDAGERIDAPAFAGLHHVDMRVEMHGGARAAAVETGDHIGAGIAVGVAGRAFAAHIFDAEAALFQPRAEIFGAGRIGFAGRVDGREADQIGGQRDEVVDALVDRFQELLVHRPI